ncbi:hypothetical protein ANN_14606 [Periplaneta americana]|uniref:Uncharacterized protein n=1 Tax=Periplaneta americana TaxID=6978 RepID=A0ABQ8SWQ1_PERAM|nr:hypothetical protein ANN_14606 [Periplaneta americana]
MPRKYKRRHLTCMEFPDQHWKTMLMQQTRHARYLATGTSNVRHRMMVEKEEAELELEAFVVVNYAYQQGKKQLTRQFVGVVTEVGLGMWKRNFYVRMETVPHTADRCRTVTYFQIAHHIGEPNYALCICEELCRVLGWLFNDTVSTTRLFSVDEIVDNEMIFGDMRPRIRHRLPCIHITVGENLGKNPTR